MKPKKSHPWGYKANTKPEAPKPVKKMKGKKGKAK